jgi:hypothetical protein
MDDGRICVVNLSKGRIGEDNMRLLGGMVVTRIQLAAQERQNILEHDRRDFYLYVDEFQNFANESFATILSEARKYKLNLTIAHQYIEQLDEKVAPAIIGNVGTIILMRIGGTDAEFFETEFGPTFTPEDMVSLAKYQIYLKLMVDGVATPPFSANTMAPIAKRTSSAERVVQVSRERYAEPRASIEEKVLRWSGFEVSGSTTGVTSSPDSPSVPAVSAPQAVALSSEEPSSLAGIFSPPSVPSMAPARDYPRIETDDEREQREGSVPYLSAAPTTSSAAPSQPVPPPTVPEAQPSLVAPLSTQADSATPFVRVVQGASLDEGEALTHSQGRSRTLAATTCKCRCWIESWGAEVVQGRCRTGLLGITGAMSNASQSEHRSRARTAKACGHHGRVWQCAHDQKPCRSREDAVAAIGAGAT